MTGLCAGLVTASSDPWFSDDPEEQKFAKRVCRQCPIAASCLDDAVSRGEAWGIWSGEDMSQRAVDEVTREMADGFLEPSDVGDVHGKRSTYVEGCRCDECTAANTAGIAEWRANRAPAPIPETPAAEPPLSLFDEIPAVTAREKVSA